MAYREHPPPPALTGLLACTWERDAEPAATGHVVLPDGCIDLIWIEGRAPFVAGPDTGPAPARIGPRSRVFGARLRPGAAGAVLGLPASELRDLRVEADLLWATDGLHERLATTAEPREELMRFLAARATVPDRLVLAAADALRGRVPVAEVAGRLGVAERTLRRRFEAHVGLTPKLLHRVLRLQRAVDGLTRDEGLALVAADAGYADQAHLTRELRALAGRTPAALAETFKTTA